MKQKLSSLDIKLTVDELTEDLYGFRVNNVYDIDSKTFLFKLAKQEERKVLLIESGIRLHITDFLWPKNIMPSGFAMKLRKHLKGRRLEYVRQLGVDRVVDFKFGSNEAAYHVILELYDKGNLVLTDWEYVILNIQRPRSDESKDIKFAVREKYPLEFVMFYKGLPTTEELKHIFKSGKTGDNIKKLLIPPMIFGGFLIEHCLLIEKLESNAKLGYEFNVERDLTKVKKALKLAEDLFFNIRHERQGFIIQEKNSSKFLKTEDIYIFKEFHPILFQQHKHLPHLSFPSFNQSMDIFFSQMESQKQEKKIISNQSQAFKKLEFIKHDHEKRMELLGKEEMENRTKGDLILLNLPLVEYVLHFFRQQVASQLNWKEIELLVKNLPPSSPIASCFHCLNLETNQITIDLKPIQKTNEEKKHFDNKNEEKNEQIFFCGDQSKKKLFGDKKKFQKPMKVILDLGISGHANARKQFELARQANGKCQRTAEASKSAFKSAEKKVMQDLKEEIKVQTVIKARKTQWFEKFYWFISSENFFVIAGRDMHQNELIVKKYLKPGDVYVHADIHGASSVVIKNNSNKSIPPVTLNEAACMALCYSVAWEAKVVTSCWWVKSEQVSKTAPSGEYLTMGSFMIRGKKNYLSPSALVMGFGLIFKLDESSIEHHLEERKVKVEKEDNLEDDKKDANEEINNIKKSELFDIKGCNVEKKNEDKYQEEEKNFSLNKEENYFPDTEITYNFENKLDIKQNNKSSLLGAIKKDNNNKIEQNNKLEEEKNKKKEFQKAQILKRGQKNKFKKIKEKYKDQDDEEREMRMKMLASDGSLKNKKKKQNKKDKQNRISVKFKQDESKKSNIIEVEKENEEKDFGKRFPFSKFEETTKTDNKYEDGEEEENEDNQEIQRQELSLLNSFTGIPLEGDSLLFCLPVCGPYQSLTNYKYKCKVTPGTTKRGKAGKLFLSMFLGDKSSSMQEKTLIKSIKELDLAKNLPGKVKVVAVKK